MSGAYQPPFYTPTTPVCCVNQCGALLPFVANGAYKAPGRTVVEFNLATSSFCGIRVVDVLQGNLQDLEGRDDFVELNRNADSMRLRIELPGCERFVKKMNTPAKDFTMEKLVRGVCKQVAAFVVETQASGNQAQELAPGIIVEQLVLVSIKRVTVGCWVPCIRLINQNGA